MLSLSKSAIKFLLTERFICGLGGRIHFCTHYGAYNGRELVLVNSYRPPTRNTLVTVTTEIVWDTTKTRPTKEALHNDISLTHTYRSLLHEINFFKLSYRYGCALPRINTNISLYICKIIFPKLRFIGLNQSPNLTYLTYPYLEKLFIKSLNA